MTLDGTRLTATLESHPRLTGTLFATLVLLTFGVSAAAAGSAVNVGP